jgi:hypothetical protein
MLAEVLKTFILLTFGISIALGVYYIRMTSAKVLFLALVLSQFIADLLGKIMNALGNDTYLSIVYDTATLVYSILVPAFYFKLFSVQVFRKLAAIIGICLLCCNSWLVFLSTVTFLQTQAIIVFSIATLLLSILYIVDTAFGKNTQNLFLRPSFWINMSMAVSSVMLIIRFGIAYYLFKEDFAFLTSIRYAHLYVQLFCNLLLIFAVVYPAYKYRNTTPFTIEL